MGKLSKLIEKTDGFLLRCLGLRMSADMNGDPTRISQGVLESSDYSSCPWDTVSVHDISISMTYKDCRPSRLAASKQALEKYVRARLAISPADRVAIVSFSDSARIEMPLTSISKAQSIIDAVMKLKGDSGTDIAPGIKTAGIILKKPRDDGGRRLQRILLLTDGRGGSPLSIANEVKSRGVLIDVIGIGGKRSAVDEALLRRVATTDSNGFTHYRFIKDADSLVKHYQQLATTSLVWRSGTR